MKKSLRPLILLAGVSICTGAGATLLNVAYNRTYQTPVEAAAGTPSPTPSPLPAPTTAIVPVQVGAPVSPSPVVCTKNPTSDGQASDTVVCVKSPVVEP